MSFGGYQRGILGVTGPENIKIILTFRGGEPGGGPWEGDPGGGGPGSHIML